MLKIINSGTVLTTILVISACSEGGNTNQFSGQIPIVQTSQINSELIPEPGPEIIPESVQTEFESSGVIEQNIETEPESAPVSLFIPPVTIVDPIASLTEIESNLENLVIDYYELLEQALVQVNDVHDAISMGLPTNDDETILRYDVDFYTELIECNPIVNGNGGIDSFFCEDNTATLHYRHQIFKDVFITFNLLDRNAPGYGETSTTIFQDNPLTNDFSIHIDHSPSFQISVSRTPEDFTCLIEYQPFNLISNNVNACNATLNRARGIIRRLLGDLS